MAQRAHIIKVASSIFSAFFITAIVLLIDRDAGSPRAGEKLSIRDRDVVGYDLFTTGKDGCFLPENPAYDRPIPRTQAKTMRPISMLTVSDCLIVTLLVRMQQVRLDM